MIYARIVDGRVVEIIELDGIEPAEVFHPDIAASIAPAGADVEIGWSYVDGQFTAPLLPAPPTMAELLAYTEGRRFLIEVGGIEVDGAAVATDRESQGMIGRAYSLAVAEPDELVDYKAASGWIALDSTTLIAIALAVGRHVRACFRREREVCDAVVAGDITTFGQVDAAFEAVA